MNLAFVSTIRRYPWGGADALWTPAAEAAAARGDSLLLAVNADVASHPRVRALINAGAVWFDISPRPLPPAQRLLRHLRRTPAAARAWIRAMDAFRPGLVIINGGGTYDLLGEPDWTAWLRSRGVPFRYIANWQCSRPVLPEADRHRVRDILEQAEALYFVSKANLDATRNHLLSPLPAARILQYPIRLPPGSRPLPWPGELVWRLAAVARLEPVKGLDLLLQALGGCPGKDAPWELDIFGRGSDEAYLRDLARHLGLRDKVRLRGFVPDIDAVWADHHLLVSPSLDEGSSLTIPEALLRGRPVLATGVGGAPEWIEPGINGFLCPAPTVPLLAQSLDDAWTVRERWKQMGERAATARSRYRPDDYRQLLAP